MFTDIEGSTALLKQLRERYAEVLAEHQALLRDAVAAQGGEVVDTQGDSYFCVFRRAKQAVVAAADAQRWLAAHGWPEGVELRVRMGIHTGEAELEDDRYHGVAVHRAARIGDAGHGGQVLCSQTTHDVLQDEEAELPGVSLRDLGVQRLKDLDRPVRLYQIVLEGLPAKFPPLKTLGRVRERSRRRVLFAAALMGVVAAAVAIPIFAFGQGGSGGSVALASVGANAVGAVDLASGRIAHSIPVGTSPGSIGVGERSVWVVNGGDNTVSRIDPQSNVRTQTIPVGNGPAGIAVGGGFVWVANRLDGTVSKIDPNANGGSGGEVGARIPVGNAPAGVAFGDGSVWVANSSDRTVVRIDPATGRASRPISVDGGADAIAVGAGAVWVVSESAGSVTRIDPRTGTVIRTISVGGGPTAVAVGPGAVWVANSLDGTVSRIDPATNEVSATVPVGAGPSGVAVTPDGKVVWVSNEFGGSLSRIDAGSNEVQTVPTGNRPSGVGVSEKTVYVAVRGAGLAHRGGTLTVAVIGTIPSEALLIDPSVGARELTVLTNDGLLAVNPFGGSEYARPVADLATSIPTPTDGGRAYTFQLRQGIRYSTGALVQPADIRRGIERALLNLRANGFPTSYFTGIVGAAACQAAKTKSCDLSHGIVTDAKANTVTFHLTAADPEFLYKLALPNTAAVPASTPLKARLPLPATGPYMVASYDAKHGLIRLVRNPRFHETAPAAQPAGYPDAIVEKFGYTPKSAVQAIQHQTADLMIGTTSGLSPAQWFALRANYAPQLHNTPITLTTWFVLNTRVPPFNNIKARQAVNYAIDRNRLVAFNGGPDINQLTCQILPPNLPGYRPYCPYTTNPGEGKYNGPDLAKARRLVAASGTMGQPVTVWFQPEQKPRGPYLVSVLGSLGYKTRSKVVKDGFALYTAVNNPRLKMQAFPTGWGADYPATSNFFVPTFTCASFRLGRNFNGNASGFCNPRIDREIAHAQALQTSDPTAASHLWSKVDREITNQAPVVAFYNPRQLDFVSHRVGDYQYNENLDQLWVR